MQFKIEIMFNNNNNFKQNKSSINWKYVTEEQTKIYKYLLDSFLSNVKITSLCYCSNFSCTCDDHKHSLDNLYGSIVQSCISAGNLAFSYSHRNQSGRRIPGWSKYVQDLCKNALFWNYVWKVNGSPNDSILTSIRKKQ